jgi:acetylornithine/succinyldiaminopimelate/putrescine aminotransferase
MGLFSETMDAYAMTRKLADAGILVLPAHYEPRAIEFRPILILDEKEAETIIRTVRDVLG